MVNKVLETIKHNNLIDRGDTVLVGVSGGPDSICLLHVLFVLKEELDIKLYAAHINHMLRGEFADEDQEYVSRFCSHLNIDLFTKKYNIKDIAAKKRISLEEAGREVRYSFFELCSLKINANRIAVGHNKNDQAETILMNIIRGTGIEGLKGMDYCRNKVIRPLLDTNREEIEKYCEEHKLNPRIDSTNYESIYTRNMVRLKLVPYIDHLFNTKVVDTIYRMSLLIRDEYDFMDYYTETQYEKSIANINKNSVCLFTREISENHIAIAKRIIRRAITDVKGSLKDIESIHIQDVYSLCTEGRAGAEIHLPGGMRVSKSYDTVKIFYPNQDNAPVDFEVSVNIPGSTTVKQYNFLINASIIDISLINSTERNVNNEVENYKKIMYNSLIQFFDYDKLSTGINIRNRRNGDVFFPYKSNGTKKLKEFFIDNKIPRNIRSSIPLIAMGNEIVWIVGYKISDKYKVTENTKRVLKLEYIKSNSNGGLNDS
jgi:tRNA(Ile)-lysidine synthase